jgi:hypothetical protein
MEVTLKTSCSKSNKLCCILDNIFYNLVNTVFELIIVVVVVVVYSRPFLCRTLYFHT